MNRRGVRSLAGAVVAAALLTATAAACADNTGPTNPGSLSVVASTDVWGSVAAAVAGDRAGVTSIYNSPDGDPHEFEPSAQDTAKISGGDVVVYNGADYDHYMDEAPKNPDAAVVVASSVYEQMNPDAATGAGEINEHFFYNLAVVRAVAQQVADDLGEKDPPNSSIYQTNASNFGNRIDALMRKLASVKSTQSGKRVAQTEPLAAYLLADAGLVDATPTEFTEAVEAGNDPPAAAVAETQDLVQNRSVAALLYNTQAVGPTTERLLSIARGNGLPVVQLTETLPEGVTDYIAWQTGQTDAIVAAASR